MKPTVFMIGWEFPPYNSGGLGTACQGLTSALAECSVTQFFALPKSLPINAPYVIFSNPDHPFFKKIHVNIDISPYGKQTPRLAAYLRENHSQSHEPFLTSMVNESYQYADMIENLVDNMPRNMDVIHAHDWMTFPAAMKSKQKTKLPLIIQVHSTEFDRTFNGTENREITDIEYMGMESADKIIAVSDYTKNIIVDRYSINPKKISVVHNGIDLNDCNQHHIAKEELEQFANGRQVVAFMGRLTGQKGPDYFVKIADQIERSVPNVLFVVAGDGDMYEQILMQSAHKNLTGKLIYTGFVRAKERSFLYKRADLFIMPSVSEPFGLVALEAAAANTPVIISKQSGVSEVMKHAIVANYWDTDFIAQNAIKILKDEQYAQTLGNLNAQQMKEITWNKSAEKCVNIYNQLLGH